MDGEVGLDVGPHEVLLVGLLLGGGQAHRVVQQGDDVREGVAEEAGDAQRHVDARAAQLLQRDRLQAGDPAGGVVPDRAHAEQGEGLGDVVAGGAHRAGAPEREPDRGRVGAVVVGGVPLDQRGGERLAGLPGELAGDGLRVDGVEVAAGRQHVDQAAQRRAGGAGRDEAALQRVQHGVQFVGGGGQARHHLGGGEGQHLVDGLRQPGGDLLDRLDRPVLRLHRLDQGTGLGLGGVGGAEGERRLVQAERLAQTGQRADAAPDLPGAQDGEHDVDPVGAGRGLAQDVQAVADLGVLDLAEPAVDVQQEVVEAVVLGALVQAEVVVEPGGLDQRPDLGADGGQLGRVHRGDVGVLVQQLLQARDVAVGVGAGHRRDEVVDQGGVGAALGLGALARVVDQEGVDQREVAEDGVRAALGGQRGGLAGQPLQVAVLAEVDDGVGAEAAVLLRGLDPAVGGQVVVARRQVGVVVDGDGVLAEAARRLDQDEQVPGADRGQHDVAVRVLRAVDVQLAGGRAPVLLDPLAQGLREGGVPAAVVGGGDAHRVAGQLVLGEPVLVVAAGRDQGVDQRVALVAFVLRGGVQTGQVVPEVHALLAQPLQQAHRAGRGVQADGVADPGVLRRVRGQHQRETALGGRDVAQPGVADGGAGHAGGALRVGGVDGEAVLVQLLEGERDGDQPAVELRHGDLGGGVQRGQAVVAALPLGARPGQAERLQDRAVQRGERARVPGLLVAAGLRVGRAGAAGGEHRGDDRVGLAECGQQLGLGAAQRGAVVGLRPGALVLDGPAERLDEGGVAAHVVGAVVEHRDRRALAAAVIGAGGFALQRAPGRGGGGRGEAVAGEQHGVGEEGAQLGQVGGAAVGEVGVRLGGDAGRDGGQLHQLGVGGLFPGQHHHRAGAGQQRVQALLPGAAAAEQADHDELGALQQRGQVFGGEPGRVAEPVAHGALGGTGAQQVGVGRRQQQDHAKALPASWVARMAAVVAVDACAGMRQRWCISAFLGVRAPGRWRTAGVPGSRGRPASR